ncbi:MAG: hypothetical protein V1844_14625 [Pseudomonadota bacterium]
MIWLNSLKSENLPSSWRLIPVGKVLLDLQYGTSEPPIEGGNTKVVGMKDIQNGRVLTENLSCSDLPEDERNKYLMRKGDLIINRTNSYDLVGKVGIFESDEKIAFASYLVRLTVDKTKICPEYLNCWSAILPKQQSRGLPRERSVRLMSTQQNSRNIVLSIFRLSPNKPPSPTFSPFGTALSKRPSG